MPDNVTEFLWWALNGAILFVAWLIRNELKEIKEELAEGRKGREDHEKRISTLEGHVGNCQGCTPGGRRSYDPLARVGKLADL